MDRETTLDEFAQIGEDSAQEAGSDDVDEEAADREDAGAVDGVDEGADVTEESAGDVEEGGRRDVGPDGPAPEPLEPTSCWSAEEEPCDCCGATVRRRWRDPDGLVCAECREW